VLADALGTGHFARVVAVDLHTPAIEGCFEAPIDHLSAVPLLIERLRPSFGPDSVIVSPDLGAVKRAERFARDAKVPMAVAQKTRLSGSEVSVRGVVGEVAGKRAIIVDDLISTAGTIEGAVHALLEAGATPDITVVASHALLVGPAVKRLSALPVRRLVTTDSLVPAPGLQTPFPIERVSLAPLLAGAIRRLHATFARDGSGS
jgi:ribose-phosphate pyrophosphokinase